MKDGCLEARAMARVPASLARPPHPPPRAPASRSGALEAQRLLERAEGRVQFARLLVLVSLL